MPTVQAVQLEALPSLGYVGDIVYVKGTVQAQRANRTDWFNAYPNMPDYLLDKIKTDSHSITAFEFANGTQVGINKDTEVLIDTESSVKDITKRTLLKKIKLTLGTIWCKVSKQEADESFTVETRGGVLGVRGTEFIVSTKGENSTEIYVLEGTVMAGPNPEALTQAILQGQEAQLKDGRVEAVKAMNIAHDVLSLFPGLDPSGNIQTGLGFASFAVQASYDPEMAAVNLALNYIPYGGVARDVGGFFGGFGFGGGPPPQPSNLAPSGMVNTYTPTFSWSGIGNAKQYSVHISKSPFRKEMPKTDMIWSARVDKTSVQYPETAPFLTPNATYFWAVVGLDEHGKVAGKGSHPSTFTLAGEDLLGKRDRYPALLHPMNEMVSDQLPFFSWNPVKKASEYALMTASRMKNGALDDDVMTAVLKTKETTAQYRLANRPLEPGKTYFWTVRALDGNGHAFAEPAPPSSFIMPDPSKSGPRPLFPVESIQAGAPLRLEWRGWEDPNLSGYRVLVSENEQLSSPLVERETKDPWLDLQDSTSKFIPGKKIFLEYFQHHPPRKG